jgi:hypothetical protein
MKRIVIILALLVATVSMLASNTNEIKLQGESNTEFGAYTITKSEAATVMNNVAYQTWTLKYSNSSEEYCILYAPGLEGNCCFIVRCDDFEVQYSKDEKGFGASLVDFEMRKLSKREVFEKIDKVRLSSQELLTTKDKTVEEYLMLMACYIPQLQV